MTEFSSVRRLSRLAEEAETQYFSGRISLLDGSIRISAKSRMFPAEYAARREIQGNDGHFTSCCVVRHDYLIDFSLRSKR